MKTCDCFIKTVRTGLLTVYILHSSLQISASDSILTKTLILDTTRQLISPNYSFEVQATADLNDIPKNIVLADVTFTEMTGISLAGVYSSSAAWGDYNNDGFLDILITGVSNYGSTPIAKIYRNNGNDTFTEQTSILLTDVGNSSVAWGDYDNDGDLDILLSGLDKAGPVCKIYRNDGNNIFTEMSSIALTGVGYGSVQWGDYDNDGDLDILLAGNTNITTVAKIYRNDNNNVFTEQTNISLVGIRDGSAQLGDYDNDGDLDILLTGFSNSGRISKIFRNDGNNIFTEQVSISLIGIENSAVDWGDYDNDGDLDILLSGYSNSGYISKIYRNNGNNTFTEQASIYLTGVTGGSVQWGDYDNDGYLDILLSGRTGGIPYTVSKIYRNEGNNNFTEQNSIVFTGVSEGSVKWGDYDSDGDLDILLTGGYISQIYRNDCTIPNSSPNVPTGLTSTPNGKNVTLSWTPQGDAETPSSTLTYNVRVGTTPGGSEIVSPHALSNGKLTVPAMGNAQLGTTFNLKNLPMRTYYWSVQAVDNGYKGSAFAAVASFTLLNADPTVTVIASKDITLSGAVISGTVNPNNASTTITFEYGTNAGDYSNWKSVAAIPSSLTGTISTPVETKLTGLNSGTGYYFRLKAVNSLGTSYSSDMSFTTSSMFTEMTGIQLTGVSSSSSAWGDYDKDGDLDILITGTNNSVPVCKIYRNDGNDTFTEQTSISLTGVGSSSVSWGDYDNDGDLDILLSGLDKVGPVCKIYRNDGNNIFTEMSSISLTGVGHGSVQWGDYDNDGDLDILLTGNSTSGSVSKIYRNDRNNIFTEQTSILFPGIYNSSVQWGDYDNDGDLDVLLSGQSNSGYISKIYRNDGDNVFTEQISILLTGVSNSAVAWGDYDNDGDLDILLSGYSNSGYISKIYRNDGNNVFSEQSSISLTGVNNSAVAWGDYDNDGDLDILLTGYCNSGYISKIYRNDGSNRFTEQQTSFILIGVIDGSAHWGDYDNDGDLDILLTGSGISRIYRNDCTITNTSPKVPTGLTSTPNGKNVTLLWISQGDTETPSSTLTYNVRVGTTPGGCEIVSPHALSNGKLTVPAMGNAQLGTNFILKNLPMNSYYWSVQAVDNGYKGSTFAAENSFTLINADPTVVVNEAGDISLSGAVISGTVNPNNSITTVTFEYGITAGVYSNWKSVAATPSTLTGKSSASVETRLTGLNSGTSYYFRVKAVNSLGTSYSTDMSFTTPSMFTEMTGIQLTGVSSSSSAWGDYDKDGDLDILITGTINNTVPICKIYRNDGNDTFTEQTSISLTSVGYSSVSWGDYDNDGDLDILLSGLDKVGPVCKIFRNDGNNNFTEMNSISLTGVGNGSVQWGDYDNDGDLDILLSGSTNAGYISKIYRNDRKNIFTEQTSITLPGIYNGAVSWGDCDNDGDLDIFLTGYSNSGAVTKVYRNDGNNYFTELSNTLAAVGNSSLQLGDYDSDGDLDILLTGNGNAGYISKVYRNEGNNTFIEQNSILLTGVTGGSVHWGDYDNDGDLDILLTGGSGGIPYSVSKIYRNDGNNIFTEQSNISLAAVNDGSVQWGDYDNDGDLDILLTGSGISKIYRNNSIIVNSAPNVPTGMTDTKSGKNVTLSWTPQGDAQTLSPALTYNVRVGTTPGGSEIVSPHALSNGKLTIPVMGNAQLGTTFNLKNLPFNTYYWSVQAVDNGYVGSIFSKEETFKVGPDVTTGQVEISSASSATLIGSIDPKGFILTAFFMYGLSETTMTNRINITQQLSNTGGLQNVSATVSGLNPVTYYYRLEAYDGSTSAYGAIKTFNTNAPWIVSYTANNITTNSASLVAVVNPKDNPAEVVFEYGTTTALGQVASTLPNPISGSTDQQATATIVSLNKSTIYFYRVKATNSSGTNYSSIKQFITLCNDLVLSTKPTGLTSLCQGTLQSSYVTSSLTAISYVWELTPATAGTITGTGPTGNVAWNPSFNGNAQIRVRGENGTCQSTWTNWLDVNLIPSPITANIIGLQNVCRGQDYIKYSVVPVIGTTYSWSVFGGNILNGAGTAEISVNWLPASDTGSVILTQKLLSTGCTYTDRKKITIKNYTLPALPLIKKKGSINLLICTTPGMSGYQWYLNNQPIAGASGQYYEARKTTGSYRVVISDKNGCFNRSEEIIVGTTTGIVIYPNPARGEIYVELSCEQVGEVVIKVVDSYGVIRYIVRSEKTDEKYMKPVILNNFVKGLYLIDIEIAGEKIGSEKILIY